MAVPLRSVVGQLSVVEGIRHPEAENVLVVEPGSFPGSTRDDFGLYALVELSGLVLPRLGRSPPQWGGLPQWESSGRP